MYLKTGNVGDLNLADFKNSCSFHRHTFLFTQAHVCNYREKRERKSIEDRIDHILYALYLRMIPASQSVHWHRLIRVDFKVQTKKLRTCLQAPASTAARGIPTPSRHFAMFLKFWHPGNRQKVTTSTLLLYVPLCSFHHGKVGKKLRMCAWILTFPISKCPANGRWRSA